MDTMAMNGSAADGLLGAVADFVSLGAARIGADGRLRGANAGLQAIFGPAAAGTEVARCFVQPSFAELNSQQPFEGSCVYEGSMRVRPEGGEERVLRGVVHRLEAELLVLLEVSDLTQLRATVSGLRAQLADREAQLAGVEEELDRREAHIRALNPLDLLTGVLHGRRLTEALEQEAERARRYHVALSLVVADVDHLAAINERHSRDHGDSALRAFAQLLRKGSRNTDLLGRHAGGTFLVVLTHTTLAQAGAFAERARAQASIQAVPGVDAALTASFGVVGFAAPESAAQFVERGLAALREAKRAGRNRVRTQ